ncbi:hypothetical protein [Micromonospora sp. NPDC126480]
MSTDTQVDWTATSWLNELHRHTGFTPHPDRLDLRGICATCADR